MRWKFWSKIYVIVGIAAGTLAGIAGAQAEEASTRLKFEFGASGLIRPIYEGATRYELRPLPHFRFLSLETGDKRIGREDKKGFYLGPSFDYIGKRLPSDSPSLAGMPTVPASFEFGLRAAYEWTHVRVYSAVRYGLIGHKGVVGEFGLEAIIEPSENLRFTFGPVVTGATDGYMQSYFSVPATATALAPYTASAGIKSIGLDLNARYDLNETWAVDAGVRYSRLVGDAAASPIAIAGSRNQVAGSLTFIRKFDILF